MRLSAFDVTAFLHRYRQAMQREGNTRDDQDRIQRAYGETALAVLDTLTVPDAPAPGWRPIATLRHQAAQLGCQCVWLQRMGQVEGPFPVATCLTGGYARYSHWAPCFPPPCP